MIDRMIYVAMSGAKEALLSHGNVSHNVANANTPGFQGDLNQFRSMPVFGDVHPTRVYSLEESAGTDMSRGTVAQTGRELDVAVKGRGWIAVQAPDGSEAYTRRGDLFVDGDGILKTGSGLPVIGNGGPIAVPPADKIDIALDGTLSIIPAGQTINELAVVDRIKLVSPPNEQMKKHLDGLLHFTDGVAEADANQQLESGALESSNVSVVDALVGMIEVGRRYELQVKMMKTADDNARSATSILRPA